VKHSLVLLALTMTLLPLLISALFWCPLVICAPPVSYEEFLDSVEAEQDAYADLLTLSSNDNGYGQMDEVKCRDEERVEYVDKCVPYVEKTCYTQVQENCSMETFSNCTGVVETGAKRECFTVNEMLCGLKEEVLYFTIQEEYQVQVCSVVKERICDTVYSIDLMTRDDFQCTDIEYQDCHQVEATLKDVTCKKTVEFQCRKEKRPFEEGYGKRTVCDKVPRENCYDTPRTVRRELCQPRSKSYCQKFSNPVPEPREKQNCHFEPNKKCELQTKSRPRKAKGYSYTQDCKPVPRQICDTVHVKKLVPDCVEMERPRCEHVPKKECSEVNRQYCYKEEKVTTEKICDKKFRYQQL